MLSDLTIQAQDSNRVNRFTDAIPTTKDAILLSPSGKLLVVPWYEYQALYRIDEQVTLMSTFGTGNDVLSAFSRDESRLFSYDAFESRRVSVWDLTSIPPVPAPIELDCERTNGIHAVDGSDWLLVNASVEGREVYHLLDADYRLHARIRVDHHFWNAEDFASIAIGENNSRILIAVTGARDAAGRGAFGYSQCIQLLAYDIDTDELQLIEREIEMNSYVREMGFRSDGRELIAVTDQTIYRLNLDSDGNVEDISTAPNGADPNSQFGWVGVDVIGSAIVPTNGSLIAAVTGIRTQTA